MKILVLGINGMLGRYVYTYLNGIHEVIGTTRRELDAETINKNTLVANINTGDIVINCIGVIKQRSDVKKLDFVAVNSLFPLILQEVCAKQGAKLIHVTTDCFLPNTKVLTENSVKKISDIKVGDLVYTHKGILKPVYELKEKIVNENLFKIKTRSNTAITCTKNHPFYGIKRKKKQKPNFNNIQWIFAKNLEEGDLISIPKLKLPKKSINKIDLLIYSDYYKNIIEEYKYFENNIKGVMFDNFKKYCMDKNLDYRRMLCWKYDTKRKPTVYKLIRTLVINKNVSWFLGLFLADGWVDNGKHRKTIHITIENEITIIRKTMNVIKNEFKVKPNIRYIKNQKSCEIYFTHQLLSEMLAKDFYNSTKHFSHTKNIPNWIRNTGRKNIINFLKGYFDGDGCFYESEKNKGLCFFSASSVSEPLIDELEVLLMFLGVLPSRSRRKKTTEKIQNRTVKVKDSHILLISGVQVKKLLGLFNIESLYYGSTRRYQKFFEDEKNWYVPVTKIDIEKHGGFVCNLEVEDDHSYLVGGGLSAHNCVYEGICGNYDETSVHDAVDVYGMSKSLGEPENATVIRTSIIGEEKGQARSLLEWVKSNKGNTINGYTNHFWNGITCLQFAKVCEHIINNNLFWKSVKHVVSPTTVSKFELVKMISDIYDLGITVTPFETPEKCDRSMSSIRTDVKIDIPELEIQIKEMKDFSI